LTVTSGEELVLREDLVFVKKRKVRKTELQRSWASEESREALSWTIKKKKDRNMERETFYLEKEKRKGENQHMQGRTRGKGKKQLFGKSLRSSKRA